MGRELQDGSDYGAGDQVQLVLNGAVRNVHVGYEAPVTR
jgi:hypothetical protein